MPRIVWARDMDENQNKELLEYFKDRQVVYISMFFGICTDSPFFICVNDPFFVPRIFREGLKIV